MLLKGGAYFLTNSVGLLSDALESGVNLTAGLLAFTALRVAAQPPDEDHAYGHEKAEYFSSGVEGILILLAAAAISATAVTRFFQPSELRYLDWGLVVLVAATCANFAVARILLRAGNREDSIALQADAHHLMTDVWTSVAVFAAIAAVKLTGWIVLDPLIALAVGVHVGWVGFDLIRRSTLGLMDTALPDEVLKTIQSILRDFEKQGVHYHALRTRRAGPRNFVSVHIQVPGHWSVQKGHDLLEEIEEKIRSGTPATTVFTHLEPIEDPRSWEDRHLDRGEGDSQ